MNVLSKALLTALLLVGTYTATAQTQKKPVLPPYYTGIINPQITHKPITRKDTERTRSIHHFQQVELDQLTDMGKSQDISECVTVLGMLDGAWRVPGVINVKDYYPRNDKHNTTFILRSYDAVFTMVVNTSLLEGLRNADGRLQAGETSVALWTNGKFAALGPDRSANNPHKRACTGRAS